MKRNQHNHEIESIKKTDWQKPSSPIPISPEDILGKNFRESEVGQGQGGGRGPS